MASTTIPATFEWGSAAAGEAGPAARMTQAELLARVDEGWRSFREAVRHVGRARIDEPTGGGWSYHDLFAHIAGWHDLTARRMRVYRTEGRFPGYNEGVGGIAPFKDADEFNARVVSSHRLVGPEALTDELDTTFRALRAEVAQLSDEQVRANAGWVIAVTGGNTYGHYEEHATELGLE
ncbi:MAG TPA: maleylpyruvate isomerase N-terminal domain-containing protein [Candidatus Limnocylindria bacterium]